MRWGDHKAIYVDVPRSLGVGEGSRNGPVVSSDSQPSQRTSDQVVERLVQWRDPIEPDQVCFDPVGSLLDQK
jgi:hypothetical protein